MNRVIVLAVGMALFSVVVVVIVFFAPEKSALRMSDVVETQSTNIGFARMGLTTDTSKANVDLDAIIPGVSRKDDIPALNNPKFIPIERTRVGDETLGVFISVGKEKRFYPYTILTWHEIVNDSIGNTHFAVTFCPLCGSAIVFDRTVNGEVLSFGVSGLLYESNLLMYDNKTESLWSQAKREAVVGNYTGTQLNVLDMKLLTFAQLKEAHPDAVVLSSETGYIRAYNVDPYTGYGLTDELYFPTSFADTRFPPKTLMYVVPLPNTSVAFPEQELLKESVFTVGDTKLVARRVKDGIEVTANGAPAAGYYEMWFSWAIHHKDDGVVWQMP